ncbi:MAG TPA: ABC transporter substrate-binding protein [Acidimicrobiales bacterium]|nr:ABC transporter substrate-binding protein [Acidimicrobiales bacterium]
MSIRSVTRSLVGGAVVLGSLTGTATVASAGAKVVNLTMWQQWGGGHEEAALDKIIKQYEALNPGVRITETPVTNSAKILTAISGGTPPDIVDLGTSLEIGEWASRGALLPMAPFISSSRLNTGVYVPSALDALTVNGQLYGLPFMDFDVGLLYNKTLFKQAGLNPNDPPTTTEQLQSDAFKLTRQDKNGRITQLGFLPDYPGQSNGQVCTLEDMGWDFGGQWYNEKTHAITANAPQNIAALSYEVSFYKKYGPSNMADFESSAGAYLTANDPFESGKLAMVYDGPWALQYIEANRPSLASQIGVAPFPAPAGMSALRGTTFIDSNPQVIPRGASDPSAAFAFIKWETTSPEVTATFAQLVANLPQLKKVPSFPLANDARFRVFINEANSANAHVWPQLPYSTEYGVRLCEAQQAALLGNSTAVQALGSLQTTMESSASS